MGISVFTGRSRFGRLTAAAALLAVLVGGMAGGTAHDAAGGETNVVVTALDGSAQTAADVVESAGGLVTAQLGLVGGVSAVVPASKLAAISENEAIRSVTYDQELSPAHDDFGWGGRGSGMPLYTVADAIKASAFWDEGSDGSGVDVAVIDTGVSPVPGLNGRNKVVNGIDVSFESQNPDFQFLDANGHGTHMAGIIASGDRRDRSLRGIAYGARIVNVKVGSFDGAVDVSQVIAAIDWVVQHKDQDGLNIRVLNLSYGTDSLQDPRIDPLSYAVEQAWKSGIVVVVAAGNDGPGVPLRDPAANPYVISVGATALDRGHRSRKIAVADFSSCGTDRTVDVVAPGRSIESLRVPNSKADVDFPDARVTRGYRGQQYLFKGSGTSQAAAVVSGAAALIIDQRPDIEPDQLKALLMSTAIPVTGSDDCRGAGQINLSSAARTRTPDVVQDHDAAAGTGSIEAARGTEHVSDGSADLVGEQDVRTSDWDASSWSQAAAAEASWSGDEWNGSSWSGGVWSGTSWSGTSWSNIVWSTTEWLGSSWSGSSWSGSSWSGTSWSGSSWSQDNWLGLSWK